MLCYLIWVYENVLGIGDGIMLVPVRSDSRENRHRVGYSFHAVVAIAAIADECRVSCIEATVGISRAHERMGSVRLTLMDMVRN